MKPMPSLPTLVIAVATVLLMLSPAAAEDLPSITVTASGTAEGRPDRAEVDTAVITTGQTAQATVDANSQIMTKVLARLRSSGFDDKNIATTRYDVSPRFRQRDGKSEAPVISGYRVTTQLRVTVTDLDTVGLVLDQLTQAGINQINGLRFAVSERENLTDTAVRSAMTAARHKAEVAAAAAGVGVGRVLKIEERGTSVPQPRMMAFTERAGVPIMPGDQTVQASVAVTYALTTPVKD